MTGTNRNVHFVGSIKLDDRNAVFTALSEHIGSLAARYPDGETSERSGWIGWQRMVFADHPDLEADSAAEQIDQRTGVPVLPKFRVRDGVDDLAFPPLGYASEALASYREFARLRDEGVVPEGVRFQVSLPTPLAVVSAFVVEAQAPMVEEPYDRAMQQELAAILSGIPLEDLAIQWDIAIEITAHDGGRSLYASDPLAHASTTVARMMRLTPDRVQTGVHLCYGDAGHKHIIEPTDLATSVLFANTINAASPRPLSWVHMPVPRDRDDAGYFAPLAGLDGNSSELVLGLIHYTDGIDGTIRRLEAAEAVASDFSVATECGFGRRPAETIHDLLSLHAEVARQST